MQTADRTDENHAAPRGGRDASHEPPGPLSTAQRAAYREATGKEYPGEDRASDLETPVSRDQKLAYMLATGKEVPLDKDIGAGPEVQHTRVLAKSTLTIPVEAGKILGIGHPVRADAYELSVQREDGAVEPVVVPRWAAESAHFYPGSYYVVPLKDDDPTEPPLILPAALFVASGGTVYVPAPPTGGETGATGAAYSRVSEKERIEKERAGVHAAANPPQGAKGAPTPSSTIKR